MITADTITTKQVEQVFHALATATERARSVMRLSQDSDIAPHTAAARINLILETLKGTLEREGAL